MKRVVLIAGAAVLIVIAGAIIWWLASRDGREPNVLTSGTVEATEAHVGFPSGGRLESLSVREGDDVAQGQQLARLDRAQIEAERRQAEAELEAARAQLAELEAGTRSEEVAQADAALRAARARYRQARREFETTRGLFEDGAVTRAALDRDRLAMQTAASELAQAREQLEMLQTGAREEAIAAQRARVRQAEARISALDAAIDQTVVHAPFGGVVTITHREPGEIVPPGTAVVTLMNLDDRWVRTYVPQDRLGAVTLGAPANIHSDTYPDRRYPGEVTFIASEAEFTPKNVQTEEERVKLVYAVHVRVTGDPEYELKPGMPVDVAIAPRPAPAEAQARQEGP